VKQDIEEKRRKNATYMREYNKRNKVSLKKKAKIYRAANKERYQATCKAWREKNKEYRQQKAKAWREANLEKIKIHSRKMYLKNRKKIIAQVNAYYHTNREKILKASREAHQKDPRAVMLSAAKARARKKNVIFCLKTEDIKIPSHCPVLGFPLVVGKGGRQPNSPSLDRINPKGPYAPANCRVISFKANTLKNDGTIKDHERVIAYMKGLL
jgi:hypothetical protein